MTRLRIVGALAIVAIFIASIVLAFVQHAESRSPALIYSEHEMLGSGHAFGFDMVYMVIDHKTHNDVLYAIVTSNEPGVEIWSPIPRLLNMPVGTKFRLTKEADNFDKALQLIR